MNHAWNKGEETAVVPNGMDLTSYYKSVEWDLMKVWAKKTNSEYPCCGTEPYPDVTFHLTVSYSNMIFVPKPMFSWPKNLMRHVSLGRVVTE